MDLKTKITQSIIANQIALNLNEGIKHTNYYKQKLKQYLNLLLPELIKSEKDYDLFFDSEEETSVSVYNVYEEYIKAIASVPVYDCQNITLIIEAYKKDPKKIEQTVTKILSK